MSGVCDRTLAGPALSSAPSADHSSASAAAVPGLSWPASCCRAHRLARHLLSSARAPNGSISSHSSIDPETYNSGWHSHSFSQSWSGTASTSLIFHFGPNIGRTSLWMISGMHFAFHGLSVGCSVDACVALIWWKMIGQPIIFHL